MNNNSLNLIEKAIIELNEIKNKIINASFEDFIHNIVKYNDSYCAKDYLKKLHERLPNKDCNNFDMDMLSNSSIKNVQLLIDECIWLSFLEYEEIKIALFNNSLNQLQILQSIKDELPSINETYKLKQYYMNEIQKKSN